MIVFSLEAHVELSADECGSSAHKDPSSSGPRPTSSFTQSPAARQPTSLEQVQNMSLGRIHLTQGLKCLDCNYLVICDRTVLKASPWNNDRMCLRYFVLPPLELKCGLLYYCFQQLEEEEAKDSFDVDVSVTSPEKIGDGMNAYVAYKVSTRTSLNMFRSKTFFVRRRFSDFLGLYEKLSVKQSLHGCIVPPPPEKSVVGMTKVKVGMDDPSSVEFVERRRAALERYLQRVVSHPSLLQDPDVREFLEREDLPRAVNTQALSGAGFLKMINKASDAVNKMTIKMNESDTWFEDKFQEVENEEQQLRKLHAVVDSLVNHRKELCMNTAVFAKSMAMLGNSEDNTALSRALSQLAEVEDKMEQLHQEQAASDFFIFAELLADYIRMLGAVRGCFDQRMRAWQRWQEAQSTLQKKREAEAKLLWANKPDKLQQAKEEITEWEARVTQYERDFDRIGMTVRKEVLRFEKEKAKDFKSQIIKYLESMLQSEQRVMIHSHSKAYVYVFYSGVEGFSPESWQRVYYIPDG
uniref:Sorting nexin-1 n=1 Tax=Sphaeramia orbicularis TaxID=375764 RepID=A0A673D023_9TELE